MKKIFILTLTLPLMLFGQKDITYKQTQDIQFAKKYKDDTKINSYTTKGGIKISEGDTLTIGKAYSKKNKEKMNYVFRNIVVGDVRGTYIHEFKYLNQKYKDERVIIDFIYVKHEKNKGYKFLKNNKEMPLYVNVFVKSIPETGVKNIFKDSKKTILNIDNALADGEIINPNSSLSRKEAIVKLKESKDLMELGLMSKEEYEKLRKKLTPIIMQD